VGAVGVYTLWSGGDVVRGVGRVIGLKRVHVSSLVGCRVCCLSCRVLGWWLRWWAGKYLLTGL